MVVKSIHIYVISVFLILALAGCSSGVEEYDREDEIQAPGKMKILTVTYTDDTVEVFKDVKGWIYFNDGYLRFDTRDGRDVIVGLYNIKKAEESKVTKEY